MTNPFVAIANLYKAKILPSLVALYYPHITRPDIVHQIGTGFLIEHNSRAVVITAAHNLLANDFKGKPNDLSFHWNGQLHYFDSVAREYVCNVKYDVAAFYADELWTKPKLPKCSIAWPHPAPTFLTVGGYQASKFVRQNTILRPLPLIHTDVRVPQPVGYVGVRYTKRRNKNSFTGMRIPMAPMPHGLSGCPMVATDCIFRSQPNIIGVFTGITRGRGIGIGGDADVIQHLLTGLK